MKKIYLLASLLFTLSCFAQGNRSYLKECKFNTFKQTGFTQQGAGSGPFQPQALIALYDSVYIWKWDTIASSWRKNEKIVNIAYNTQQMMTSSLQKNWSGASWFDSLQTTNTYDTHDNQLTSLQKSWTGSAWVNASQTTNTFDANNNKLTSTKQTWSGSAWVNSTLITNTFDSHNNQLTNLNQTWSGTAWTNSNQYIYTYNANNKQISSTMQTWSGTAWTNTQMTTYTYDVNNNQIGSLIQSWSGTAWTNQSQSTNTFNANNKETNSLTQYWTGIMWVNSSRQTWTYDANNNNTNLTYQFYMGASWSTFLIENFTYDVNNLMKTEMIKEFNTAGTKVVFGDSIYLYYHAAVGIEEFSASKQQIKIFPSPNNGNFIVETGSTAKQTANIFDVNGKLILNQTISDKSIIDAANLNDGIYFVQIKTSEGIVTKKIVIQH